MISLPVQRSIYRSVDTGVVGGGEEDSVGQDERVEGPPLADDRVPGVLRP